MTLRWSRDFIVVDGDLAAVEQLPLVGAAHAQWIVIVCEHGARRYACTRAEILEQLARSRVPYRPAAAQSLDDVLDLREWQPSRTVASADEPSLARGAERSHGAGPSGARVVEMSAPDGVRAVGSVEVDGVRAMPPARSAPSAAVRRDAAPPTRKATRGPAAAAVGLDVAPSVPPPAPAAQPAVQPLDDEGTTPVRHPSIESTGPLRAGAPVTLVIDLLRAASSSTAGGPLELGEQAADWNTLDLGVTVVSSSIDFDHHGRGKVTIRRNDTSIAARIDGQVLDDVPAGTEIEVHAQFWAFTRCCGSAVRRLLVEAGAVLATSPSAPAEPSLPTPPAAGASTPPASGAVRVEPAAEPPDLTVFIALFDRSSPGRMHWRVVTPAFEGLPPQLDGSIDLGQDPAAEAAARFKQFANLERGQHRALIEGFGEQLWDRAPAEFRAAYWALHDHYQRPLTIQFVSDDAYLPWELMRPVRDGEIHPPLALRHSVARWIGRWNGYMRNRLAAGRVVTVAPKYRTASNQLSLAEATAARLRITFGADAVEGTWPALNDLLEAGSGAPVGVLYFTGHGVFDAGNAAASAIKLQDRPMTVDEVARRQVHLGERDGTLVFFNACEVGATGRVLGSVGGWADAFLSRHFRAFIAPLWAIDEEDAAQVTNELLARIITDRVPVAAALRDLRAAHGDVSPTFYSYLLYGDVTARIDALS